MPPTPDNQRSRPELIEELLAEALGIIDSTGDRGLQRFLEAHPNEAAELREALATLDRLQLLEPRAGAVPDQFGDFLIKKELGKGGMGIVFVAEQRSLGREVALKIVRPDFLMFPGARERFRREIESVARLEHPAIVPILATGVANDIPYYAMPLLRGQDAERVSRRLADNDPRQLRADDIRTALSNTRSDSDTGTSFGPTYWQAIVRLIHQTALGIEHAHVRGVLHRDLKPSNIFITHAGQAVVLDFGLARPGTDQKLTRTGSAPGSPAYMAPEQVRGEIADERTDIYGLAATLHCLLGLRPPYGNDNSEELRRRILAGEREELRQRAGLPPELLLVLECALDVDRRHRYASAQQFADDLQAVLEGRAITARRLPRHVRAQRFLQRHPTMSSVAVMALAFLALLPAVLLWQEQEASAALKKQVEKTRDANIELETQIKLAKHNENVSIRAISDLLAGLSTEELRNKIGASPIILEMLENALRLFDSLPSNEEQPGRLLGLKLDTMLKINFVHEGMGNLQLGEALIDEGLAIAQKHKLNAMQRTYLGRFLLQKAIHLKKRKAPEFPEAVKAARRTLQEIVDSGPTDPFMYARLSDAITICGDIAKAEGNMELAEAEYLAANAAAHVPDVTDNSAHHQLKSQYLLARFYRVEKRYDEALAASAALIEEAANQPRTKRWPPREFMEANGHNERYFALRATNKTQEALQALHRCIAIYDQLIIDSPGRSSTLRNRGAANSNLALVLLEEGQVDQAIQLLRSAIIDQKKALKIFPRIPDSNAYLRIHRKVLARALRNKQDWPALEVAAFDLVKSRPLPPDHLERAACDLLLCSQHVAPERQRVLRDTAFNWLGHCRKVNWKLSLEASHYDCIRSDPRFAKLQ